LLRSVLYASELCLPTRLGCALSGDGDGERGEALARPGPAAPAGGGSVQFPVPGAAAAVLQLATWLISCVLWHQEGQFVSPGCPNDSCQRSKSFWKPPSEGETWGRHKRKGDELTPRWERAPKATSKRGILTFIQTPVHTHLHYTPTAHTHTPPHTPFPLPLPVSPWH
jgi:hypothetical protein